MNAAQRQHREDERHLDEQQPPVGRLPEGAPRAHLEEAVHDAGHQQGGDRDDRERREARHRPGGERPALATRIARARARTNARPPIQADAASTCTQSLAIANAPATRAWPESAGVAAIATPSTHATRASACSPRRRPASASGSDADDRKREHRPDKPDATELRLQHVSDQRACGRQRRARGRSPSPPRDRSRRATRPPAARPCTASAAHSGLRTVAASRSQHKREDARPADAEQDEREVEEANDVEATVDRPRAALLVQHLARNTGRPGPGLADVEDERATDRVRVRRHHPPGDRIRPPRQARPKR